jgi:Ni,Fe-hydrogenase III large subunit
VVPGGVAGDLDDEAGAAALIDLVEALQSRLPGLRRVYDNTASLQDRTVSTGIVSADLVNRFGAGGYVGRASGRGFDTRRAFAYPPYGDLRFAVPVLTEGDVNARLLIRLAEIEASLDLILQLLAKLEPGSIRVPLPAAPTSGPAEGLALVEGFRGDILVWLRIGPDGRVQRCHPRDPSWFQWPLLEAAIENNIVADFPLCNKSFNCSYAGHDL